ncbi:hypothetical protein [Mycolicibacterium tusciae]|uniref:hypothetical protein n=1 Tax=Mycolicibacterium tusciae TaxID=75922 RepID=UPI00024A15DD|nr:hypothetical protein [Mycolicibacterium tusciae]
MPKLQGSDERLFVGALCGIVLCLGVGLQLRQVDYPAALGESLHAVALAVRSRVLDAKWLATTLQVAGTTLTAFGLTSAYVRSKHQKALPDYLRWQATQLTKWFVRQWKRLLRRPIRVVVQPNTGAIRIMGHAPIVQIGPAALAVNEGDPIQLQIAHLVVYINDLNKRVSGIDKRVSVVDRDIGKVRNDLSTKQRETLAHMQGQIVDFDRRLDMKQVVDLRWAIRGLVITAIGSLLSYWA